MNKSPLIELNQLHKQYLLHETSIPVLKNISLSIQKGELLAIKGASGSGKSTLMNIIGLLDSADSGDYFFGAHNIKNLTSDELALMRNQQIGFVFQQFNLLPRLTATQNIALPFSYRRVLKTAVQHKIAQVLERVGMSDYALRKPVQLSGGQQQRIAIARALVTEPEVILADEPTGALDSQTGQDIMRLFLDLHAEGRTIIIVTHDERIANMCSRQVIIGDGEIIGDSS